VSCVSSAGGAGGGSERRSLPVREARKILEDVEAEAVLPQELLAKEAVSVVQGGLVG
jgi:ATP-dependent protease HslVU (ClpYQ) ATPase subunit